MDSAQYKAAAELWAARVAEAYRTAEGASLDAMDRRTLASYVVDSLTTCLILHIPGPDWGYAYVNPAIGVWEDVRQFRRGYRLISANEADVTVTMDHDLEAR